MKVLKELLSQISAEFNGHYRPMTDEISPRLGFEYHRDINRELALKIFELMYTSRRIDDNEQLFLKKGQAWFGIYCAGAEVPGTVAGLLMRKTDPIVGYYRDRASVLARGVTPYEMFLEAVAAKNDPASGGHQMPAHFGNSKLAVVGQVSAIAAHCLVASGLAHAIKLTRDSIKEGVYPSDSIVYMTIGDSGVSEGEFYEALKYACQNKGPLLIHIINNRYGISVPIEEEVPNSDLKGLFGGFPGVIYRRVDGTSVRDCYDEFKNAITHVRKNGGPYIIETDVVRLYSHSASDDQRKYRPGHEVMLEEERDPIPKFARELLAYGVATSQELNDIVERVDREMSILHEKVLKEEKADLDRLTASIYNYDRTQAGGSYKRAVAGSKSQYAGQTIPLAEALNRVLVEQMERDKRIVVWGEDVADFSSKYLKLYGNKLAGKGGVFGVTKGLQKRFGANRVWNSPIAEATIVGAAVGFSLQGFLPVVEVQFRDYLNPAWQQLVDQVATMSYRTDAHFRCPMVIRMASGGYLLGAGALWHSEMAAGTILHHPGLRVAVPSTPRNGAAALRAAIYCGDPVVFLEPKALYRRTGGFFATPYPDFDDVMWPGEVELYGDGKDLLLVGYGNTSPICYEAMIRLKEHGIDCRFLNLVWLNPLNKDEIRKHARITGKVLIVDEDRRTCGASSAIADAVYEDRVLRRQVDVERLNALDCRVSSGPAAEYHILPQLEDVLEAALSLARS